MKTENVASTRTAFASDRASNNETTNVSRRATVPLRFVLAGFLMSALFACGRVDTLPTCEDTDTVATVESAAFSAVNVALSDPALGFSKNDSTIVRPRLTDIKHIGLAAAQRQRGCVGTLGVGKDKTAFAYIIGPHPSRPQQLAVMGANRAIVETRFNHIAAQGSFANTPAPLSRDNLEKALWDGFEVLQEARPKYRSSVLDSLKPRRSTPSETNPDRDREIADIEPIGPCRQNFGGQYECLVLIERNDPLLAALGMRQSHSATGKFTFERNPDTQQWRVSADFANEYARFVASPIEPESAQAAR
jgi:hypothetical protein